MKQIHFFAAKQDLIPVIRDIEFNIPLKYVRMGQFSTQAYESYASGVNIPNLGEANNDSAIAGQSFLVTMPNVVVNKRPIKSIDANRYAIDQMINPDSVIFAPGGTWLDGFVLNGRVATVSDTSFAREVMRQFGSAFKRHFCKIKAFSVGPSALCFLKAGKRLTASTQSPSEYDLVL